MKKLLVFVGLCCLCGIFANAQELEKGVQNAMNELTKRLRTRLEVSIGSLTLEGTDAPTPFSRQLSTLVHRYADNIPLYFKVVGLSQSRGGPKRPEGPPRGIIKGTFAQRGNRVEVFLYLVSDPDGTSLGTSPLFTFPLAELSDNALVPENEKSVREREQVFAELSAGNTSAQKTTPASKSTATQGIHIQAFFNSESMTYLHRDELQMTVIADRDCWFKVIYIDVNNRMKMLYPNSYDNDNYLRANVPRDDIFKKLGWRTYEPYGAETILLVASSKQFEKIEQEYDAPEKPMTADAVRTAVKGNRGVESELKTPITFSGEGEARYTITVIKPDEQYSYSKPQNMKEFLESTRKEVERQGGTFSPDGNEKSADYIINGVRGSYRVPNNAPDTIEFAMYNNYTGSRNAAARTRGSGFNFNFERPGNITQAIQMVRSGIEGSGGTFSGNEREGNFSAKGIAGQYRVSDLVSVTITEKPFVVPNSLIEKEVKSYFGGR